LKEFFPLQWEWLIVALYYLFNDELMMIQEKRDFVMRIEKECNGYTPAAFVNKMPQFDSFSISTGSITMQLPPRRRMHEHCFSITKAGYMSKYYLME
jgi:3'-phosphoadenosine 5'-phosphosulfate sulfotransferase (PAPS reductase)/FAD synthetase